METTAETRTETTADDGVCTGSHHTRKRLRDEFGGGAFCGLMSGRHGHLRHPRQFAQAADGNDVGAINECADVLKCAGLRTGYGQLISESFALLRSWIYKVGSVASGSQYFGDSFIGLIFQLKQDQSVGGFAEKTLVGTNGPSGGAVAADVQQVRLKG